MNMKHTPGPWIYKNEAGDLVQDDNWEADYQGRDVATHSWMLIASGKKTIALSVSTSMTYATTKSDAEMEANACLIAAAPDLLEALMLVDSMMTGVKVDANMVEKKVHAAIAKAIGVA